MSEPFCFAATAVMYIAWLAFLAWLVKYFNSALPLFLILLSPSVKYTNGNEDDREDLK